MSHDQKNDAEEQRRMVALIAMAIKWSGGGGTPDGLIEAAIKLEHYIKTGKTLPPSKTDG